MEQNLEQINTVSENVAFFKEKFGQPKVESKIAEYFVSQIDIEEAMKQNG